MRSILSDISQKIPIKKQREFIFASSFPILTVVLYFTGGFSYWHHLYTVNPFRTIFGTGLMFIIMGFTIGGGRYLRKMFWIRRKRIRNISKWEKSEKSSSQTNQ